MPTHTESNQPSGTKPAIGCGPNRGGDFSQEDDHHPAAGWGAAISVSKVLISQGELIDGTRAVFKMNHENGGYDCPGCAWPDDRNNLPDCSNMCHEASGRALSAAIGTANPIQPG